MGKIRAFIAIEITNPEVLENIIEYQTQLQKSVGPLKLVQPNLMHITLKFLGNISLDVAKRLYEFIDKKINSKFFNNDGDPIFLNAKGVGDFRKSVFFVDIDESIEFLREIHNIIEKETRLIPGIKQHNKKFTPHLTIARKKRQKPTENPGQIPYQKLNTIYQQKSFGRWKIKKVVMKKSILSPQGPQYSTLSF